MFARDATSRATVIVLPTANFSSEKFASLEVIIHRGAVTIDNSLGPSFYESGHRLKLEGTCPQTRGLLATSAGGGVEQSWPRGLLAHRPPPPAPASRASCRLRNGPRERRVGLLHVGCWAATRGVLGLLHVGCWTATRGVLDCYTWGVGLLHVGCWAATRGVLDCYTWGVGLLHVGCWAATRGVLGLLHVGCWTATRGVLDCYTWGVGLLHVGCWTATRGVLGCYTWGVGLLHVGCWAATRGVSPSAVM